MSKASQIIVLCEDEAHKVFVTHFLKKGWNITNRKIRVLPYPNGEGSGKKYVLDNIANEAKAFRQRRARASTILLVIQDADELSVEQVQSRLNEKLGRPRGNDEPIAYIIPKWHIETWLAYLDGQAIDEEDGKSYKNSYGEIAKRKDARPLIHRLADNCRENKPLVSPPESLLSACEEFNRIRKHL